MPIALLYNETAKRLANKDITRTTLKIMLLLGATFNPDENSILTTLSAFQVSGNNWPVGGPTLTTSLIAVGVEARLNASNIAILALNGPIGPADAFVLYDSTTNYPVMYVDFEGTRTAAAGTNFRVNWGSTTGIIRFMHTNST